MIFTRARQTVLAGAVLTMLAPMTAHAATDPWTIVPTPTISGPSAVVGLAVTSAHDAWAVGEQSSGELALHWDGTAWTETPTHAVYAGGFNAVSARSANDAWAVGSQGTYNVAARERLQPLTGVTTLIEHWDGHAWTIVQGPNPGDRGNILNSVVTAGGRDVWAVGSTQSVNSDLHPLVQRWDGHAWSVVPTPVSGTNGELNSVVAYNANDVWAVGTAGGLTGPWTPLSLHWDGHTWTQQTVPAPNPTYTYAQAVAAGAPGGPWLGGFYRTGNSKFDLLPCVDRWQGGQWTPVTAHPVDQQVGLYVLAMAADKHGTVWVGGNLAPVKSSYLARWDGHTWTETPSPAPGLSFVSALATTPNGKVTWAAVYAGTGSHRHPVLMTYTG